MQVTLIQATIIQQALGDEIRGITNAKKIVPDTLHNDLDVMANKRQTLYDNIDAQIRNTIIVVPDAAQEYLTTAVT